MIVFALVVAWSSLRAIVQVHGPDAEPTRGAALPLPGPPADARPSGAAHAEPGDARKLRTRRRHEPEDIALFVPRVILAVPRFVIAGVFTGVSGVLAVFDDGALARIRRVLVWNRAETIGWFPIASFQGGYGISLGARIYFNDLFGHGESVTIESGAGGLYLHANQLRFQAERLAGSRVLLDVRVRYDRTPRLVFQGLGNPPPTESAVVRFDPRATSVRTRYTQDRALAALRLAYELGSPRRAIRPGFSLVFNHRRFGRDRTRQAFLLGPDDREDPSIAEVYDVSRLPGFAEGVDVVRLSGNLELDFRDRGGLPSRGFRLVAIGGGAPPQARDVAFAHYGAEASVHLPLSTRARVLVVRLAFEGVHGDDRRIPFSELPRLGGPFRLRGYRLNRFRDRRLVLGTAEYRFPIHQVVGAHLFVDVGRVAYDWREMFDGRGDPWHWGVGGGFSFRTLERLHFRIDLGYGEDFLVVFSTDAMAAFADRHLLEL